MVALISTVPLLKLVVWLGKLVLELIFTVPPMKVHASQVPPLKVSVLPGVMLKMQLVQLVLPTTALKVLLVVTL